MVNLNKLLGNRQLLSLLLYLLSHPTQELSYTQLRTKTKLAKATLTKWLNYLHKESLVYLREIGRNKLYRLNRDYYLTKQLKILINLSTLEPLLSASKKHKIQFYLFGSAARGEDVEESDIDLLVLGEIKKEELISEISKLSKKLKKKARSHQFTKAEWFKMSEQDSAFYERVEKDKIQIN